MALEITATVLRGEEVGIIGISLVAGPDTYAELFVQQFPRALCAGKATIAVEDGKLVFRGPGLGDAMTEFEVCLTPEELKGLLANVFVKGKKRVFKPSTDIGEGFSIVVED